MVDIRKIIIIFVVAILFAVLVFSVIEAAYPEPKYDDFCDKEAGPRAEPIAKDVTECSVLEVDKNDEALCNQEKGYIAYDRDSNGCAEGYYCETCHIEHDKAREQYNNITFYISSVLALIAIFVGMYLPAKENTMNEWIGTGFLLGGAFALFFGTMRSFSDLGRFVRPIVIFIELALVIFIAYKKIGNLRTDRKEE